MAVTEYKPRNVYGCRYAYDQLENMVYLVSKEHVKDVIIDNGEAYISGLTQTPLKLDVLNLQFSEESSLDERYKFTKQVTFSINGYVPFSNINEKYYVILKSKDGTFWMVNVDFPSKVTYIFVLNDSQYQTDFTFSSVSNFPTLRLLTNIGNGDSVCKSYRANGIDTLELLETDYCRYESDAQIMHTYGKDFVGVDYNKRSLSLQETFDGENTTTTIEFNIGFDAYKSSWHYNLLEFLQNHYSAIIKPKQGDEYFLSGFHFGLEPSFKVATTSDNGQSDIITVTLTETSLRGSYVTSNWTEQEETDTRWVYVKYVDNIQGWECVGMNQARYLLQQEVNQLGSPTGRYKSYQGHSFPTLNIVGSFTTDERFQETYCTEEICQINTTIPTSITYRSATCNTYTLSASCDWNVSELANYMTVSPISGNANQSYTVSVCNSKTPTTNESSTFVITSGNNTRIVNVNLTTDSSILNPTSQTINCLSQNVAFNYNSTCPISVIGISSQLTYQITNSQLIVTVPRNSSTANSITWNISVKDCNNNTQTVQIIQDKTYERWVTVDGYICSGTTSYTKQQRYTGTTANNINTPTSEYRGGSVIQTGDTRCGSVYTRWTRNTSAYTCVDGDKWSIDEEEISTDGTNWVKNGNTRLGEKVESSSDFCLSAVTYEWRLTDRWQCSDITPPTPASGQYLTFVAQEDGTFKFSGTTSANTVQYSLDSGTTWTSLANNTNSPTVTSGNEIWWKGNCTPETASPYGIGNFSSTSNFAVKGNAMSLLYGDDFNRQTSLSDKNYAFVRLFYGCNGLTSAENLMLPTTTLSTRCYYGMFEDCTSLTTVPDLLATTLAEGCYYNMFKGCTSLTIIPSDLLPTTTMAASCYRSMFNGCSGLTTVPTLPATTLSEYCYLGMFGDCTSLTTVPSDLLPATTLSDYCYQGMFNGCISLTTAPTLPATTLAQNCYYNMFSNCTSLTTAPTLPATTLAKRCYQSMFLDCTSLTTAPSLPATTLSDYCYQGMFNGCTSLTTAPHELPATTLTYYCYGMMFQGCTSLTTAPELPATTLVGWCYQQMFSGCTSLNYVKCLGSNATTANNYSVSWLKDVASSGTFVKASSANWGSCDVSKIPCNWSVQNA